MGRSANSLIIQSERSIALPEEYTKFDPNRVLREFTEQFKKRYDVECVSALHHNKTKKNYHIHLIFSERRLLPEPEVKIATRSVFYDELGKRVRTKKEITGEDGQIREGCTVIKKGEVYESHLFTQKDDIFKNKLFLDDTPEQSRQPAVLLHGTGGLVVNVFISDLYDL